MVKPRTRPNIPFELLQQHFDKTLTKASSDLGVSVSYLKSACRVYGIKRWPYRKIQNLKTLVHFLKEQGRGKGSVSIGKEEIERLNNKIRSLLHSHLEECQATLKSLEKSSQERSSVEDWIKGKKSQEEPVLDVQDTRRSAGSFDPSVDNSNVFGSQELLDSRIGREQTFELRNQRVADIANSPQVRSNGLRRNPSLVSSSLTEAYDLATNASNMLEWNLPALAIHLGVDGIRNLGPSKLVQLACDYYYKPLPDPYIHTNQVQSNGQYLKSLNQRLKVLQEEKQQLENTHALLARTFREASLRELRR
ncbi:hypothetical protein Gasu2_49360 [Galdieria sulphuraria]|uniref:Transcription factor n=1 Tax=Galdieria sulphuraria TaxID=130081 RepID=M2X2T2_GALSU|nr:transcription factor [Galdieria sulphuraria]EME30690.1 transcription factor [Galdieria sulphuraria]GJD10765.1 hypothetical protein Gasu2_49360 [Galdieria sulphuraria]|eukprot:XP_005707210.1 transcription factor [Galdieria sulphuraria]